MRFRIQPLRRRGAVLPHREALRAPGIVGDLRIESCQDDELGRQVRTATLHLDTDVRGGVDRPMLRDVQIIGMSPQGFTLTGFERLDGADYAQSWFVTPAQP